MRENTLHDLWRRDGTAFTGWLTLPCAWSAEVMAHAGFDALVIDLQHGLADQAEMLAMLQAIGTTAVPPLVRVPWNEPSVLMRALDAGAYGIICPMIGTGAECTAFVAACRYPPQGARSFGPTRSMVAIGADYVARAGAYALTFAMIETAQAMENLEAIAGVAGLDGLFVGPWDLSLALGFDPPVGFRDARLLEACDRVVAVARKRGLIAGLYAGSAAEGLAMAARGFRLVNIATDTALLQRGAAAAVTEAKGGPGASGGPAGYA